VQRRGEQVVELVEVAHGAQALGVEQAGMLRQLGRALVFMVRRNMRV
jgi:hypothetical protein